MADQPGELAYVWNRVIADLSGTSAGSGASALSAQQRAFLRLTRPLGLIDGTALLAAPSEFAKDAIERILRRPISEALGRHLGRLRHAVRLPTGGQDRRIHQHTAQHRHRH